MGVVEWADSVDPSHKCGYAYLWLPAEDGKTPPKTKTFQPGTEVVISRYLSVGTSPAQAYGQAIGKIEPVTKVSLRVIDPNGEGISSARVDFSKDGNSIPGYPDENGNLNFFSLRGNGRLVRRTTEEKLMKKTWWLRIRK